MRSTWTLGLASMAVLGLAACNKAQPPEPAASAEAPAAPEAAAPAAEALAPGDARERVAPPPPAEVIRSAPDIGYAADFDRSIEQGADYDAWAYEEDGRQLRAWQDPRQGWRIVEPGPDGERIYYYRPGQPEPYLVREGGIFFVFTAGRLDRAYDARGRNLAITAEMRDRRARDLAQAARRARQQAQRADRREDRRDERRDERRDDRRNDNPPPSSARPMPLPAPQPEPQRPRPGVEHPGRDHDRNGPLPSGPVNPKPDRPAPTPQPRPAPVPSAAPPTRPGQPVNPRPERPDRPARPAPAPKPPAAAQPAPATAATPRPARPAVGPKPVEAKKPTDAKKPAADKAARCERRADKGKAATPGCP